MYWYAVDYLNEMNTQCSSVILNKKYFDKVPTELLNNDVFLLSFLGLFSHLFNHKYRLIFTPTPHALPFFRRQVVVLHDSFPFIGTLTRRFKKVLLCISLFLSGAKIAVINKTAGADFARTLGTFEQLYFFPNKIDILKQKEGTEGHQVSIVSYSVGLVGTDSSKKNYQEVFEVFKGEKNNFSFFVYGQNNDYILSLKRRFPHINITLIDSDNVAPFEFINMVNALLSAAEYEGFGRLNFLALQMGKDLVLKQTEVNREIYGKFANQNKTCDVTFFQKIDDVANIFSALRARQTRAPILMSENDNKNFYRAVEILGDLYK